MCDIGRFDYHWIESEDRLRKPLVREAPAARRRHRRGTRRCVRWAPRRPCRVERVHVPGLGARIERGDLRDPAAGQRDCASAWTVQRKAAAARHEVPGARRGRAKRDRGARTSACRSAPATAGRTSRRLRTRWRPAGSRRSTCSIRVRTDRWGMCRGWPRRGSPASSRCSSTRACCPRNWRERPTSCCPARRGSRRNRPTPTTRGACRPRRRCSMRPARRATTGTSSSRVAQAIGQPVPYAICRGTARRALRRRSPATRRTPGSATSSSRAR